MAQKQTYSKPVTVWSPDLENDSTKQIASSAREISHLKLIASGAAAHVDLYNSSTATTKPNDLVWSLDASKDDNDECDFANPLLFNKGIYAVLTEGKNFNPMLCVAYIPDTV